MTEEDGRDRRQAETYPQPRTVLITDDSATIRMMLKRTLQAEGIRINEAANGSEAIAYCIVDRPDLILLDIDMPVMDGVTTLANIKGDPKLAEIPVLMLTAHTEADEVAQAFELGAQDYLRKPCAPVELVARVKAALKISDRQEYLYRRNEELGVESETDPLTGLGNRRQLARRMSEFLQTHGTGATVGVALADIDHFKQVNDSRGHVVGDLVLQQFAQHLEDVVGEDGVAVRWGGEEFMMIAATAKPDLISELGESLRQKVEQTPVELPDEPPVEITVSVGCAFGTVRDVGQVIAAADAALYRAKKSGRNRVDTA